MNFRSKREERSKKKKGMRWKRMRRLKIYEDSIKLVTVFTHTQGTLKKTGHLPPSSQQKEEEEEEGPGSRKGWKGKPRHKISG